MRIRAYPVLLVLLLPGFAAAARAQTDTGEFYSPYLAEKNVEVGQFYMKKGNYPAAIERFQEAIRHKPNFAKAHRLLGEASEKNGDKQQAIEAFTKYLEILPSADDAGKIRKRITKLKRELERQQARRAKSG